jgi:hypothetical protein
LAYSRYFGRCLLLACTMSAKPHSSTIPKKHPKLNQTYSQPMYITSPPVLAACRQARLAQRLHGCACRGSSRCDRVACRPACSCKSHTAPCCHTGSPTPCTRAPSLSVLHTRPPYSSFAMHSGQAFSLVPSGSVHLLVLWHLLTQPEQSARLCQSHKCAVVPQEPHLLGFVIGVSRGPLFARCGASGAGCVASRSKPKAWACLRVRRRCVMSG